ncbi:MAG: glycosyltransferase family 4 protein [Peptostreptococcus sp.]|uniref:glycosyltransferase family 4 protein n=1 Tax=Peptostreptococcus sp. TaxID=1262 RepID=UPI002FC5A132
MKVLHVSAQKPDSTGSGIYLSGIINGMKALCEKQALVAGIDREDCINSIEKKYNNEVDFFPVVYNSGELDFNVPGMSDNMPYSSTRYMDMDEDMADTMRFAIREALLRATRDFNPDIIVCHHLYFATSIVRELFPDKKIVAICHGTCIRQMKRIDFKKDYIKDNVKKLDMIFALHDEQKNIIQDVYEIEESKIKVLGSGYDSSVFYNKKYKKEGPIKVSYAGKLSYSKGLLPFIEAINSLDYPTDMLEFVFAGNGSLVDECRAIKEYGAKSNYSIDFIGRVDQFRLSDELNKSDIFVLPSYYEGLPLVILEALSCGNYVISTDVDGVKQWLGNKVNDSGLIDYVDLPKMKEVSLPYEEEIPMFVKRLKESLEKAIEYRILDREKYLSIEELSWNGLAAKLYDYLMIVK